MYAFICAFSFLSFMLKSIIHPKGVVNVNKDVQIFCANVTITNGYNLITNGYNLD